METLVCKHRTFGVNCATPGDANRYKKAEFYSPLFSFYYIHSFI